jgi:hypothetical protein
VYSAAGKFLFDRSQMARQQLLGILLILIEDPIQPQASEPTSNAQIKIVATLQMSLPEALKLGAERRKRKRGMFTVRV